MNGHREVLIWKMGEIYRNRWMYEVTCSCGFKTKAFGKQLARAKLLGHCETAEGIQITGAF